MQKGGCPGSSLDSQLGHLPFPLGLTLFSVYQLATLSISRQKGQQMDNSGFFGVRVTHAKVREQ